MADSNPTLCACGCGQPTPISTKTCRAYGHIKGMARKFVPRHHAIKHGLTGSHTKNTWAGMVARCNDPNSTSWRNYGKRGIRVCDRWLKLENFVADMGLRPDGTSLDRINNDGNYEPGNCRWATCKEQHTHRRGNVFLTYMGETKTIRQWADSLGMKYSTLFTRLRSYKWPVEKALSKPKGKYPTGRKPRKAP